MLVLGLLFSVLFNLSSQQTCGEAPAECWTDMARKLCEAVSQPTTTLAGRSFNPSKIKHLIDRGKKSKSIFTACSPAMESFEMMIQGICNGLFGAEYSGSSTAASCVGSGGSCYDSASGASYACCSGLSCIPSTYHGGGVCAGK